MTAGTAASSAAWTDDEGARRVRALFADRFAAAPDGVWAAPGRVNLIGEHTDYNAGLALPMALDHRTFAALRVREDGRIRVASAQRPGEIIAANLDELAPASDFGWAGYVLGVAWALRESGLLATGFDVALDSCVPVGAGLSSSAALECAVAVGLAAAAPTDELIAACVRAENEFVGAPTGAMDQTVSLRGRAGHALLVDFAERRVEPIPFDTERLDAELLVIDTRAAHALADGEYARRRDECARAATAAGVPDLRRLGAVSASAAPGTAAPGTALIADPLLAARARHVVTENARVLGFAAELRRPRPRLETLGALLDASHASLRDDYEVSCRELDLAVDAARAAGAHGARMTGGGFGGSAIALVDSSPDARASAAAVRHAVAEAFRRESLAEPAFFLARAGEGASQIR